jgi:hypothetical protein
MREVTGNLWTYPADIRVITTNGTIKKNGECVMGRGCALEAARKNRDLPKVLGNLLKAHGNHCFILFRGNPLVLDVPIASFPVKHEWYQKADIELIKRSCGELVELANDQGWIDGWKQVVLPRPGCGNGQLRWEDVKPVLAPILDDRFHVITF